MICDSYFQAIKGATPSRIESIDMARRGLHNEGSDILREASRAGSRSTTTPPGACSPWCACCTSGADARAARQRPVRLLAERDPLAHGREILRYLHGRKVFVQSAGVRASEVDPFAVAAMDEIGIDISRHRSRSFEQLDDEFFDLVISLAPEAQHRAVELTRNSHCELRSGTCPTPAWSRARARRGSTRTARCATCSCAGSARSSRSRPRRGSNVDECSIAGQSDHHKPSRTDVAERTHGRPRPGLEPTVEERGMDT